MALYFSKIDNIRQTCPRCEGLCRIEVIETMAPKPKNLRIGCSTHGFYLPECFDSVESAIDAWNRSDFHAKHEN